MLKLITTIILSVSLSATSASAWNIQEDTDPFDDTTTSFLYSVGETLKVYGTGPIGRPVLHMYDRKDDVAPFDNSPITSRTWALFPGDNFICEATGKDPIRIDVKLDGVIQKVRPRLARIGTDGKAEWYSETWYGVSAKVSQRTNALVVINRHDGKNHGNGYHYQNLPEQMVAGKEIVLRYKDGCGNGGVFKFNLNK